MAPLFTGLRLGFGRSAEVAGVAIPNPLGITPGDVLQGGFFAGYISHTANGIPTHALIVAPAATGATGTGYTLSTMKQWKTANTTTAGTTSTYDGATNSANMNDANHPAAQFCETLSIGGYTDWYLPARYELEIAYQKLKPDGESNNTSFGINAYAVPARDSNYTAGDPAQTSLAAFQTGGAEAFVTAIHWSSTEGSSTTGWRINFLNGDQDADSKGVNYRARAFRKVAL